MVIKMEDDIEEKPFYEHFGNVVNLGRYLVNEGIITDVGFLQHLYENPWEYQEDWIDYLADKFGDERK